MPSSVRSKELAYKTLHEGKVVVEFETYKECWNVRSSLYHWLKYNGYHLAVKIRVSDLSLILSRVDDGDLRLSEGLS